MKIKAIPIKSRTLCKKCRFHGRNECLGTKCENCELNSFKKNGHCICVYMSTGERCEHFQKYEKKKEIELKPCPFCGGGAKISEFESDIDHQRMKIECVFCGATIDWTQDFAHSHSRTTRIALNESAIDMWNRRDGDV